MRKVYFLSLLFLLSSSAFGQMTAAIDGLSGADDAKTILNGVIDNYEKMNTLTVDFFMTVKHPGFQLKETIKGYNDGNKYRLTSKSQNIICDGKTVWFHIKETNKVVQAKPDPSEANIIFPDKMLRIYEQNYSYKLGGEFPVNGTTLQKLEFTPKSSMEEFTKINVYIDKTTSQIIRVSRFGKDGSLTIIDLKNVVHGTKLDPALFKLEMS